MTNDDFDQLVRLSIMLVYGGLATLLVSFVLLWIGRTKTPATQPDTSTQRPKRKRRSTSTTGTIPVTDSSVISDTTSLAEIASTEPPTK